jgi:hypothetical protein
MSYRFFYVTFIVYIFILNNHKNTNKMCVDTNAIIRKGVTIEQIENALSEKYTDVEVR